MRWWQYSHDDFTPKSKNISHSYIYIYMILWNEMTQICIYSIYLHHMTKQKSVGTSESSLFFLVSVGFVLCLAMIGLEWEGCAEDVVDGLVDTWGKDGGGGCGGAIFGWSLNPD
jgi:hypothetical protein